MAVSPNLALTFLEAGQAQKHVTVNEALRALDTLVQAAVQSAALWSPPPSPMNGQRWIVAPSPSGAWTGQAGRIAVWQDNAWAFLAPAEGWSVWDRAADTLLVYTGTAWVTVAQALGLVQRSDSTAVARGAAGAETRVRILEEHLTGLSGATRNSSIEIPDRAVVLGVTARVTTAITGATSFDVGITGEPSKFGGLLGIALGSTNIGVIGPQAFYAPTAIRLTANGGSFTGGAVRIAIHCLELGLPA